MPSPPLYKDTLHALICHAAEAQRPDSARLHIFVFYQHRDSDSDSGSMGVLAMAPLRLRRECVRPDTLHTKHAIIYTDTIQGFLG